jgi:hypothetical protein
MYGPPTTSIEREFTKDRNIKGKASSVASVYKTLSNIKTRIKYIKDTFGNLMRTAYDS